MSEQPRHREAALFRRCFLFMLIVGLLGLIAGALFFIVEENTSLKIDPEFIASLGFIWFTSGCVGLLASVLMMKSRFLWLLRLGSAVLIVLSLVWSLMVVTKGIHSVRNEAILTYLTYLSVLDVVMILFLFLVTQETKNPFHVMALNVLSFSLLFVTLVSLVSFDLELWFVVPWLFPLLTGWALFTVLGIGTLQTIIRIKSQNRGDLTRTIPLRAQLTLTCPSCGEWQELPSGPARCDACGFRMIIKVEEPRCECGYLLYRLVGRVCPECGLPVEAVPIQDVGNAVVPPAAST